MARITWVVGPLMVGEAVTAVAILLLAWRDGLSALR
jgi:hypothetical protein